MSDSVMFEYWQVLGNKDQTEGRGGLVVRREFLTEEAAVNWADSPAGRRSCGVMGVGAGEVKRITISRVVASVASPATDACVTTETKVWGYRKADWLSQWDYGYIDQRDRPDADPDFGEYMRLKAKFEN